MVTQAKMPDSPKESKVARPRELHPDTGTTAGMFGAYLAHLIEKRGIKVDDVALSSGISRATIFRWLSSQGDQSPSITQMDALAKALGLADAWALKPPKAFIDSQSKK